MISIRTDRTVLGIRHADVVRPFPLNAPVVLLSRSRIRSLFFLTNTINFVQRRR